MLQKTKAISLSYIRYKESSVIARFITEQFGLQSFVVNGVRSAKSKMPLSYFQPLQLNEVVQYYNEKKDLHRLVEIKTAIPLADLPFNPAKTSQAIFIAELVSRCIKEGQSHTDLFTLIWNWIIKLDARTSGFESYHIHLIWLMLQDLGFQPESWKDIFPKASYQSFFVEADGDLFFESLNQLEKEPLTIGNANRKFILDSLLSYMQTHMDGLGQIRSLSVLRDVFG